MKQRIAALSLGLFLSACATTPGKPSRPPSVVEAARREYALQCAPDAPNFGAGFIQSADLNGDGVSDHIVNAFDYTCRNAKPFCSKAGCEVQVFLSGPRGLMEQRFNGYLRTPPRIVRDASGAVLVSGEGKAQRLFNPRTASFQKR